MLTDAEIGDVPSTVNHIVEIGDVPADDDNDDVSVSSDFPLISDCFSADVSTDFWPFKRTQDEEEDDDDDDENAPIEGRAWPPGAAETGTVQRRCIPLLQK